MDTIVNDSGGVAGYYASPAMVPCDIGSYATSDTLHCLDVNELQMQMKQKQAELQHLKIQLDTLTSNTGTPPPHAAECLSLKHSDSYSNNDDNYPTKNPSTDDTIEDNEHTSVYTIEGNKDKKVDKEISGTNDTYMRNTEIETVVCDIEDNAESEGEDTVEMCDLIEIAGVDGSVFESSATTLQFWLVLQKLAAKNKLPQLIDTIAQLTLAPSTVFSDKEVSRLETDCNKLYKSVTGVMGLWKQLGKSVEKVTVPFAILKKRYLYFPLQSLGSTCRGLDLSQTPPTHIALKSVPAYALECKGARRCFTDEIMVHLNVTNVEGIVPLLDLMYAPRNEYTGKCRGGQFYMVTPWAPTGDLLTFVQDKICIPEEEALCIFGHITKTVAEIHRLGYCHRDLKPDNVVLVQKNPDLDHVVPEIIDFGAATSTSRKHNLLCGTMSYAPPEVIAGKPYDGAKVDIWSLGVLLYVLLYGRMPWLNEGNDIPQALAILSAPLSTPPKNFLGGRVSSFSRKLLHNLCNLFAPNRPTADEIWEAVGNQIATQTLNTPSSKAIDLQSTSTCR